MAAEFAPLLPQYAPGATVADLTVYPTRAALSERLISVRPVICFVDATSDRTKAQQVLSDLASLDPQLIIVAMFAQNDPDYLLKCLRAGAIEFLQQPFTGDQMQAAIERASKITPAAAIGSSGARVYCVMPVKGACGASTIAYNLAYHWKRQANQRTLLADLDPITGTLAFLLKAKPSYSFLDLLAHADRLDSDLWRGLVTAHQGVDVLFAPETLVHGMAQLQDATPVIEFARRMYDNIIVDTNGVYGEWNTTLGRLCDELVLVTTNELSALQATQRALAYLEQQRIDRYKLKLVLSRYRTDIGLTRDVINTALQMDVFELIPSDVEAVQRGLLDGRPIVPASPFGRSLKALAHRLSGTELPAVPEKKGSGLTGLLSIFGR